MYYDRLITKIHFMPKRQIFSIGIIALLFSLSVAIFLAAVISLVGHVKAPGPNSSFNWA